MLPMKYFGIAALALSGFGSAFAQNTANLTRTIDFHPFGLGSTETARIDVTNIATTVAGGTAASCVGTVAWVNAAGATIGAPASFTTASGATSSISLPFSSAGISGARGEIRAVLTLTRSATAPAPCSALIALQTYETSSGATHIYTATSGGFPQGGFGGGGRN